MGVQKGIEDDVLGEIHAIALDMHEIQSSIIELWLKALSIISSFVELWCLIRSAQTIVYAFFR